MIEILGLVTCWGEVGSGGSLCAHGHVSPEVCKACSVELASLFNSIIVEVRGRCRLCFVHNLIVESQIRFLLHVDSLLLYWNFRSIDVRANRLCRGTGYLSEVSFTLFFTLWQRMLIQSRFPNIVMLRARYTLLELLAISNNLSEYGLFL